MNLDAIPNSRAPERGYISLRWVPFLILLASAAILVASWNQLPERWIVHWNAAGRPDGWSSRTLSGVFAPLGVGAVICAFLEALATGISFLPTGAMPSLPPASAALLNRLTAELIRTINSSIALVFSLVAVGLPLLQPEHPGGTVVAVLLLLICCTLLGVVRMARAYQALVANGKIPEIEGFNGIIYRNPDDPRLIVPKMMGIGVTFNFAHPWAWPLLGFMLAGPIITIILILAFT